jgi:putative DNA primase/helicase
MAIDIDAKAIHAQEYVDAGYFLFPCTNDTEGGTKKPKRPICKWTKGEYDALQDVLLLPDIYGVRLGPTDLVLDVDPRRYPAETDSLNEFCKYLGIDIPALNTFTVLTGSVPNGYHFYFKKPAHFRVRRTLKPPFSAIEIKSIGQYVIGAGSIHPSGNLYEVASGRCSSLVDAPQDLLAYLEDVAVSEDLNDYEDDSKGNIAWVRHDLLFNTSKYESTYALACRIRQSGVSQQACAELLKDAWISADPNTDDEIDYKVANAYKYAQNAQGCKHPKYVFGFDEVAALPTFVPAPEQDDLTKVYGWDINRDGELKPTIRNVMNFFVLNPPIQNMLRMNTFAQRMEFKKKAPWHGEHDNAEFWNDEDSVELKLYLSKKKFNAQTSLYHEAAVLQARMDTYHPVKDYASTLSWDGVARSDRLFIDYAGSPDTPYIREVAKNVLIGAWARIYQPGCQLDTMAILEGIQGTQKTSFIRILGGEFYGDVKISSNKDTLVGMLGKWIIEQSELKFRKTEDVEAVKSFLSITVDTVRPPYARFAVDIPRSSIFIGTINPGSSNAYLTDPTGNRRFWPVQTGRINLQKLQDDRDQLMAEALHRYRLGEPWWITDQALIKAAIEEQEARLEIDIWEEIIAYWLEENEHPEIVTYEFVAKRILSLSSDKLSVFNSKRIANALTKAGYENGKHWSKEEKKQMRGWVKIIPLPEDV